MQKVPDPGQALPSITGDLLAYSLSVCMMQCLQLLYITLLKSATLCYPDCSHQIGGKITLISLGSPLLISEARNTEWAVDV